MSNASDTTWIFGYGSLMFKWPKKYPYVSKEISYIRGYRRKFAHKSNDHRGTKENPGRVVTLIKDISGICVGVAYEVSSTNLNPLLEHLDYREKCGYDRIQLSVYKYPTHGFILTNQNEVDMPSVVKITDSAILWVGSENPNENPEFVKDEDELVTADIILNSVGPSGKNIDYLLNMASYLRHIGVCDPYVMRMESIVLHLERKRKRYIDPKVFLIGSWPNWDNGFNSFIGLRVFHISRNLVSGRLLVCRCHSQPSGIMHGGVSLAIAEDLASGGAVIQENVERIVGIQMSCSHISPVVADGTTTIIGHATPIHIGKSTQIWQVIIVKEEDQKKVVCRCQLTCMNIMQRFQSGAGRPHPAGGINNTGTSKL